VDWDDEGETEDVYTALMDLLDGGRRKEVAWKASSPFQTFADYAALDKVLSEYREVFDDAVREVTLSYGQPRFLGERSRPDFPSWSDALQLAVWAGEVDELACYLGLHHARRDDPVELRIGVR
jgi:hypothetical protein